MFWCIFACCLHFSVVSFFVDGTLSVVVPIYAKIYIVSADIEISRLLASSTQMELPPRTEKTNSVKRKQLKNYSKHLIRYHHVCSLRNFGKALKYVTLKFVYALEVRTQYPTHILNQIRSRPPHKKIRMK